MTDSPDLHRDLGRVEGRIEAYEQRLARVEEMVADIHEAVLKARGGWKMLLAVGTLSASIGAFLTKILAHLKGVPST